MKWIWISLSLNRVNQFKRVVSSILLQLDLMWVGNPFLSQVAQICMIFFFPMTTLCIIFIFLNIWICKSCLNCGSIIVLVIRIEMLAVWEPAVQFDGCVCCRILTSSFHDWLDFMEEMMKGATVYTISYITSSSHTLSWSTSPSLSIISLPMNWHTFQLMLCHDH